MADSVGIVCGERLAGTMQLWIMFQIKYFSLQNFNITWNTYTEMLLLRL